MDLPNPNSGPSQIFNLSDLTADLLDQSGQAILCVDQNLTISFYNNLAKQLLGISQDHLNWSQVSSQLFFDENVPLGDLFIKKVFENGMRRATNLYSRTFLINQTGQKIPISIYATPLKTNQQGNQVGIFLKDISYEKSQRFEAEQNLKSYTSQLESAYSSLKISLNNINVGLVMTDAKGKEVFINDFAKLLICLTASNQKYGVYTSSNFKMPACSLEDVHKAFIDKLDLKSLIDRCLNDKTQFDLKSIEFHGLYLNLKISPLVYVSDKIETMGVVVVIENVTQEKALEKTKDDFFAIASHELRTPLTAIRGNTALIQQYYQDRIPDQDFKEMIEDIHTSTIRLIDIVNDFLDTSRLEQGRMKFNLENFDLEDLSKQVINELHNLAQDKKLYLNLRLSHPQYPPVTADRERVKQVLTNLVGNAIKFTDQGGVTIALNQTDGKIKVTVSDTGRGVSAENQKVLFKKFQQASDNPLTRDRTGGTGLGLYISKLLIEKMGGEIGLESSHEGQGSAFYFSLPIAKV